MKKIALIIFLAIGINTSVHAQTKTSSEIKINEKTVCNKWVFSDIINPKLSKKELEENKSLLEGVTIEIRQDKTCLTSFIFDLEGTWTLDLTENRIIIKDEKGTVSWKIHSLTKDEIQLSRNKAEQIIIFKASN
jgi:hypothetical protein